MLATTIPVLSGLCGAGIDDPVYYVENVGGINWTYVVSNGKAIVARGGWEPAVPVSTSGAIVIPSLLGGMPVSEIGASAFSECIGLTSVTIPDGVSSIGDEAFCGCNRLTNVDIPSSVVRVGNMAFSGTPFYDNHPDGMMIFGGVLYRMKGKTPASVAIPYGVKSIGTSAFYGCSNLANVTIPDSVENIGRYAFGYCSGLMNIEIPNSVTNIENCAFFSCVGLTNVTIPDSVTSKFVI